MAVWPASPGNLPHLVPREGLSLAASPDAYAWDLTESVRPNYSAGNGQVHGDPSSHWADSSPRAHDGHTRGERTHAKRHGPKVSGRTMVGHTIAIHNGKEHIPTLIVPINPHYMMFFVFSLVTISSLV